MPYAMAMNWHAHTALPKHMQNFYFELWQTATGSGIKEGKGGVVSAEGQLWWHACWVPDSPLFSFTDRFIGQFNVVVFGQRLKKHILF